MANYTAPPTPPVVFKASSPATTATQSDLVALASVLAIAVGILTVAVVVLFFKISNMSQSRKSLSVVEPVEPVTSGQDAKPSHSLAVI